MRECCGWLSLARAVSLACALAPSSMCAPAAERVLCVRARVIVLSKEFTCRQPHQNSSTVHLWLCIDHGCTHTVLKAKHPPYAAHSWVLCMPMAWALV